MHTFGAHPSRSWILVCLVTALMACDTTQGWAASVSTQIFGRYEMILQEGVPTAIGEILGTVRRRTGLPEYPLVWKTHQGVLELGILGPGNRPIQLASAPIVGGAGSGAGRLQFSVERSAREGETLTLWVRQAHASQQRTLTVDLQHLERLLEGPR